MKRVISAVLVLTMFLSISDVFALPLSAEGIVEQVPAVTAAPEDIPEHPEVTTAPDFTTVPKLTDDPISEYGVLSYEPMFATSGYIVAAGYCGGSGEDKAEYLAGRVSEMGYTADDFYIYAGCGNTGDMAYPNMVPQLEAMKELTDTFIYCDNFADGNFYYYQYISSGHSIDTAIRTVYNALPKLFG